MWSLNFLDLFLVMCLLPVLSKQAQPNIPESKISKYLEHYQGPGSEQLEPFSDYHPSLVYNSPQAQKQARQIYDDLSSFAQPLATDDLTVAMNISGNLQDTSRAAIFTYDNSEDECDFVVVRSTHGFWILKLRSSYVRATYWQFKNDPESRKRKMKLARSKTFQVKIKDKAFSEVPKAPFFDNIKDYEDVLKPPFDKQFPEAHFDNFEQFLYRLYVVGGKITHILTIKHNKSKESNLVFAAVKDVIKEMGSAFIDPYSLRDMGLTWSDVGPPFEQPSSRTFFAAFYYNDKNAEWVSLSMYGPMVGLYELGAAESARQDGIPAGLWAETQYLEIPVFPQTGASHIVLWSQFSTLLGFQNDPENLLKINERSPGVAIVLLTSKGFLLEWYPSTSLQEIERHDKKFIKVSDEFKEKVRKAARDFQGAEDMMLITLVSTMRRGQKEVIYNGAFLDHCLSIVQREIKNSFPHKWLTATRLIVGNTDLTGVEQRFIICSTPTNDGNLVAIYYRGVEYATFKIPQSGKITSNDQLQLTVLIGYLKSWTMDQRETKGTGY